jgi:hypothetical protein
MNPSHCHYLDIEYGHLSAIRNLMDIHPSLCYVNQVKNDSRLRISSEYHVKANSETAVGFPLFINTIVEYSLYLHAQDSDYIF